MYFINDTYLNVKIYNQFNKYNRLIQNYILL